MEKRFSLLNTLLSVINSEKFGSLDSRIAQYFLDNFENLSSLNIYDVSADCYCTRQYIRQFCLKIGFSNFTSLKKYTVRYKHIEWEQYNRFTHENFQNFWVDEINEALQSINRPETLVAIRKLCKDIFDADSVTILVDDSMKSLVSIFQRSMFYNQKVFRIISNTFGGENVLKNLYEAGHKTNSIINTLGVEDLVIVVSVSGNFANAINEIVNEILAKKILITANYDATFLETYSDICYLSDSDRGHEGINAYTVYGLNYFFDILSSVYLEQHGDKDKLPNLRKDSI